MHKITLPPHEEHLIHTRKSKYALITFTVNEGEKIRKQLLKMKEYTNLVDIIIADGNSTDGSLDLQYLSECNVTTLLKKAGPPGLSAQMRLGIGFAILNKYDGVIVVDGNGKDDLSAIPSFIKKLEQGFDHVQGSRYIQGGEGVNTPFLRHWGVKLLHAPLITLAAGFRYTDTTNGFRAYSKKFLVDPKVDPFRDIFNRYELHYYLAIRAARLGFKVCEIPVKRSYPFKAKVPTKISPFKGNFLILKTLFLCAMQFYNPKTNDFT